MSFTPNPPTGTTLAEFSPGGGLQYPLDSGALNNNTPTSGVAPIVYNAAGAQQNQTFKNNFGQTASVAAGAQTVNLANGFTSALTYIVVVQNSVGTLMTVTAKAAKSFTFTAVGAAQQYAFWAYGY